MVIVLVFLLLLWLALGILGLAIKALFYLAIIGFGLFVATGIVAIVQIVRK